VYAGNSPSGIFKSVGLTRIDMLQKHFTRYEYTLLISLYYRLNSVPDHSGRLPFDISLAKFPLCKYYDHCRHIHGSTTIRTLHACARQRAVPTEPAGNLELLVHCDHIGSTDISVFVTARTCHHPPYSGWSFAYPVLRELQSHLSDYRVVMCSCILIRISFHHTSAKRYSELKHWQTIEVHSQ